MSATRLRTWYPLLATSLGGVLSFNSRMVNDSPGLV